MSDKDLTKQVIAFGVGKRSCYKAPDNLDTLDHFELRPEVQIRSRGERSSYYRRTFHIVVPEKDQKLRNVDRKGPLEPYLFPVSLTAG
uniref:Transposase n=1 Tax=Steinernema glaseri TaxID=37863 RepID=A0A1I7Z126_9BILA